MGVIRSSGLGLAFLFGFNACVSRPPSGNYSVSPSADTLDESALIFPFGNYRHDVDLHIPRAGEGGARDFSFQGLAQLNAQTFQLVVLSPFQTTVMKIVENRGSGEVRTETYMDAVKRHEARFLEYYRLMRRVFVLRRDGAGRDPGLEIVERTPLGPSRVRIVEGDKKVDVRLDIYEKGIPRRVEIEDPRFTVKMKVHPL